MRMGNKRIGMFSYDRRMGGTDDFAGMPVNWDVAAMAVMEKDGNTREKGGRWTGVYHFTKIKAFALFGMKGLKVWAEGPGGRTVGVAVEVCA